MRQELGKLGEDLACTYLKQRGYKILTRNYRKPVGEIDIICKIGEIIIFVEVKTRTSLEFGYPEEAVNNSKRKTIRTVARHYLQENNHYYKEIRFDVISILMQNKNQNQIINHIEAAF